MILPILLANKDLCTHVRRIDVRMQWNQYRRQSCYIACGQDIVLQISTDVALRNQLFTMRRTADHTNHTFDTCQLTKIWMRRLESTATTVLAKWMNDISNTDRRIERLQSADWQFQLTKQLNGNKIQNFKTERERLKHTKSTRVRKKTYRLYTKLFNSLEHHTCIYRQSVQRHSYTYLCQNCRVMFIRIQQFWGYSFIQ